MDINPPGYRTPTGNPEREKKEFTAAICIGIEISTLSLLLCLAVLKIEFGILLKRSRKKDRLLCEGLRTMNAARCDLVF